MRRLLPLFSLLLLALWLPATQHCALEAADLPAPACADHGAPGAADTGDTCSIVENGAYVCAAGNTLQAPAPILFASPGHLCLCLLLTRPVMPAAPALRSGEPGDRPRVWLAARHFVQRAAPSPRAPSGFPA